MTNEKDMEYVNLVGSVGYKEFGIPKPKLGAPKRFDKYITFNMRDDVYQELVINAKYFNINVSEIIRLSINHYLDYLTCGGGHCGIHFKTVDDLLKGIKNRKVLCINNSNTSMNVTKDCSVVDKDNNVIPKVISIKYVNGKIDSLEKFITDDTGEVIINKNIIEKEVIREKGMKLKLKGMEDK